MTMNQTAKRRSLLQAVGSIAAACLIVLCLADGAGAEELEFRPITGGLASQAILHEESGRYFQVIRVTPGQLLNFNWGQANALASRQKYKGRRGRLAIIDDPSVHEFLTSTFRVRRNTWIGLRYMCSNRALVWVNGEKQHGFAPWGRPWSLSEAVGNTGDPCRGSSHYLGVAYTPSMRWLASGHAKGWKSMLVEYPPPAE